MQKYDNIVNHSRPESRRPKMSMHDRAAQFSLFAALTGHEDAISETARRVNRKIELVYFVPDKKKEGGSYVTVRGTVKNVDTIERKITLTDGTTILFDDVLEISGDLFDGIYE